MKPTPQKRFLAIVRKSKDSCYGVEFPDLPGCFSAGDTIEEAAKNASEALGGHLALLRREGEYIPESYMDAPWLSDYIDDADFHSVIPVTALPAPNSYTVKFEVFFQATSGARAAVDAVKVLFDLGRQGDPGGMVTVTNDLTKEERNFYFNEAGAIVPVGET